MAFGISVRASRATRLYLRPTLYLKNSPLARNLLPPAGLFILERGKFIHEATRNDTKEKRGLVGPPRSSRSSHPSSCYFV